MKAAETEIAPLGGSEMLSLENGIKWTYSADIMADMPIALCQVLVSQLVS